MTQKFTKEEIEQAFLIEMPYFYELQNKIKSVDNGTVAITVRKYKGKVTDYVVTVSTRNVLK